MNPAAISKITGPDLIPKPHEDAGTKRESSFGDMLSEAVHRVSELQKDADVELRRLIRGEPVDLHRVLLAGEKAGLASQLMMSVRNKVVDAYQEVMQMQV